MYIKNCRNGSKFKHYSPFQLHRKLKDMSFEVGNFSYTQRCGQARNITTKSEKNKLI
jgi:hypothetical protein